MLLTDKQKKMLTENLLNEKWHDAGHMRSAIECNNNNDMDLWSERDKTVVRNYFSNRTFLTPQDLMDCKEALVKKRKWEEFENQAYVIYEKTDWIKFSDLTINPAAFTCWLFRTVNEKGEAHFCRLVAEFMEAQDEHDSN